MSPLKPLKKITYGLAYEHLFLVGCEISKVLQHKPQSYICIQIHMYKLVSPLQFSLLFPAEKDLTSDRSLVKLGRPYC